jgi:hypothetical protein
VTTGLGFHLGAATYWVSKPLYIVPSMTQYNKTSRNPTVSIWSVDFVKWWTLNKALFIRMCCCCLPLVTSGHHYLCRDCSGGTNKSTGICSLHRLSLLELWDCSQYSHQYHQHRSSEDRGSAEVYDDGFDPAAYNHCCTPQICKDAIRHRGVLHVPEASWSKDWQALLNPSHQSGSKS